MRLVPKPGRAAAGLVLVAFAMQVAAGTGPVAARAAGTWPAPRAASCGANLANSLRWTADARQLVVVDAPSISSTTATATLWQRSGRCFARVGGPWPAWLGWHGLSSHHLEGDGTTPIGTFGLGPEMYGIAPDPGLAYRYHRLVCGDWWDEDPATPDYNRFVHVPCGVRPPFGGGSEALWTETTAYRYFAVIEYNSAPIVPGRGSAIFLHVSTGGTTNGCVSLGEPELVHTLRWLRPTQHPLVVIGTATTLREL
ncbi:MAG: L,D-transpeptidase family protein [Acidimicrobiales bacterium]|jgi:L,D-peptidoglycan transpeptidase YkuD (ErfK/YbiS/YcfS/YnhG family)